MSVRIGHASISENSSINGTKGDQTSKEVKISNWYSDAWNYMFIHPDANVRERHAKAIEDGCNNEKIGYGQSDRNTLYAEAVKVGMDLSKINVAVNTDCSAFQNVCAVASKAPGVTYGSNGWTTSTMINALKNAGYKVITNTAYLRSADYCVRGAIIVKSGHTVCALDNGAKYKDTLAAAGLGSSGSTTTPPSTSTGNTGSTVNTNSIVNFTGNIHYSSSTAKTGKPCKPGKAKITNRANGATHPYHLIAVSGGGSTVYGWVDEKDIEIPKSNVPYLVSVTIENLNIRKSAGTDSAITGTCPIGHYTIIEEADGPGASKWGKLKSGAGWISLDYANKL